MQGAPKYNKINITWVNDSVTIFDNVGMVLTFDKLIIINDTHDSITNQLKTNGTIFELSDVKSYETITDLPKLNK